MSHKKDARRIWVNIDRNLHTQWMVGIQADLFIPCGHRSLCTDLYTEGKSLAKRYNGFSHRRYLIRFLILAGVHACQVF